MPPSELAGIVATAETRTPARVLVPGRTIRQPSPRISFRQSAETLRTSGMLGNVYGAGAEYGAAAGGPVISGIPHQAAHGATDPATTQTGPVHPSASAPRRAPSVLVPFSPFPQASGKRWSLSAWALVRQTRTQDIAAGGGQLGGSQAGARLALDLTPGSSPHFAIFTRISSALTRPASAEAAIGVALQPDRAVPVTIAVERRARITNGARNAFAAYVGAGVGPFDLPARTRLDGYAQAGVVGVRQGDLFMDGKMSISRAFARENGLRVGIALSGGAQPGLARLDIGPELTIPVTVGTSRMRAVVEWRERVAGQANPESGLTLTLAADF